MFICEEWDWYSFLTTITEGGLDNDAQRRENGSARLGSARLGRSIAPFFQRVKSYIIQFITNQLPETGRIMPWLRLFAFVGRMVVWYWSPNHDRQINLFRLNLLSSPACPLSEEVNGGQLKSGGTLNSYEEKTICNPTQHCNGSWTPACHSTGSGFHGLRHLGRRRTGHVWE